MFSKKNISCRSFVIKAIERFKDGVFNTFISYYLRNWWQKKIAWEKLPKTSITL